MKKLFLYIDESKDFKNNTLFLGGLVSFIGLHAMNTYCQSLLPQSVPYELKSTRIHDRELFESIIKKTPTFFEHGIIYNIDSDRDYESCLIDYISQISIKYHESMDIGIFVDSIKIAQDLRKYQKTLGKRISKDIGKNISIEFKKSDEHLSIQFADLAIGIFRRKNEHKKISLVDVSLSKSETTLRTTYRDL